MSSRARPAPRRRPHHDVVTGGRFSRTRLFVIAALVVSLLVGGGVSLLGGASAQPGRQPAGGHRGGSQLARRPAGRAAELPGSRARRPRRTVTWSSSELHGMAAGRTIEYIGNGRR